MRPCQRGKHEHAVGLKRDLLRRDDHGEAIESATRTLQFETEGLSALKAELGRRCATASPRRSSMMRGLPRPRHRHRHGQERPCRPEGGRDPLLDRHARLFRASERSQPRRPRHDHARGHDPGLLLVGRDGRTRQYRLLFAPLRRAADRGDVQAGSTLGQAPTWCWRCRKPRRPARTGSRPPPRRSCSSRSATASPSRCSRARASPRATSRRSILAASSARD